MSELKTPAQSFFKESEEAIREVLSSGMPALISKAGSAVRELVVRPLAYIYTSVVTTIQSMLEEKSAAALSTSTATDTEEADAIASNYFTFRNPSIPASGVVTFEFLSPVLSIPKETRMQADGVELSISTGYVVSTTELDPSDPTVQFVKAYKGIADDGTVIYTASIPVTAEVGAEIGTGTAVEVNQLVDYVSSAWISSPVTGGRGVETDAELLARCAETTANAGIGSVYGVSRMVKSSPYAVLDVNVEYGESELLGRGRYNTTNINPGGFVDCYVKTANQIPVETIQADSDWISIADPGSGKYVYRISMPSTAAPGALSVRRVLAAGDVIPSFTVSFLSSDGSSPDSARLSASQRMEIEFESARSDLTDIRVEVEALPRIAELSAFVKEEQNSFIGQDILVKGAVPVSVSMQFSAKVASEEQVDAIKDHIVSCINRKRIGDCTINFSDLCKSCAAELPGVELRLPCGITFVTTTKSGNKMSTTSETGIATLEAGGNDQWPAGISYLSTAKGNIRVEVE